MARRLSLAIGDAFAGGYPTQGVELAAAEGWTPAEVIGSFAESPSDGYQGATWDDVLCAWAMADIPATLAELRAAVGT